MSALDELIKKWRARGHPRWDYVRIPKKALARINIPEDSKRFLNEGGLMEQMYYPELIKKNLPRLTKAYPGIKSLPASFARYRVLGYMSPGFQCLDEEASGSVVNVILPNTE